MPTDTAQAPSKLFSRISMGGLATATGTVVATSSLVGFFGSVWWFFDLFSHFRVQYSGMLLLLTVGLMVARQWRRAVVFGGLAVLNLLTLAPLYASAPQAGASVPVARAFLLNVSAESDHYAQVEGVIRHYHPDVLVLLEMNDEWVTGLKGLRLMYPHAELQLRPGFSGIAVLSRFPLRDTRVVEYGGVDVPTIITTLMVQGQPVQIIGTHPLLPRDSEYSRIRNAQLAALAEVARSASDPVILLGDLNVTPWSPNYALLVERSGLKDSAEGYGWQPTWPSFFPPFLIPIDHCLASQDLVILGRQVGPNVGSDHYPLIVDFAYRTS
jgi:endonuclease/exonuclease/phosphatase (EEP) superfamily protein YafD